MIAGYKSYLLAVLLVVLVFNKVEHAALGVLLQDMKTDLDLTDTQLGLLSGIAFTLFYAVMGIPVARWADRGNRVTIISITTALQCGALALSGLTVNFIQLLLVRVGVAVGEAGCVAPANSLIADYFARAERARATSRYMLGYPLSAVLGLFLGGWLNELYGWRVTFMVLGLPGIALALLVHFTLREPRLAATSGDTAEASGTASPTTVSPASVQPNLKQACLALWTNKTFRHLVLGYSLITFFGIGIVLWAPTFFRRTYGMETGELGIWFAVIWGAGGIFGSYWSGELASRYAANNERLQVRAIAVVFAVSALAAAGIYLAPNRYLAFGLLLGIAAVNYGTAGPLFATIQTLVPRQTRAVAVATTYLCTNLIGMGLGPLAVGALSDYLNPLFGAESLRYALLALCPGYLWACWHLWHASKTVHHDLEIAQRSELQIEHAARSFDAGAAVLAKADRA
jgi:MFS family permease